MTCEKHPQPPTQDGPILFLFAGKMGSGKDTLAQFLHPFGFINMALADALKEVAAQIGEFPVQWCYTRKGKEQKLPLLNDITVGSFLQKLGTDVGRTFNPALWAMKLQRKIDAAQVGKICVTDVRFPNEAQLLLDAYPKAYLVSLTRNNSSMYGERDPNHPSEKGPEDIRKQFTGHPRHFLVDNNDCSLDTTRREFMQMIWHIIQPERFEVGR